MCAQSLFRLGGAWCLQQTSPLRANSLWSSLAERLALLLAAVGLQRATIFLLADDVCPWLMQAPTTAASSPTQMINQLIEEYLAYQGYT